MFFQSVYFGTEMAKDILIYGDIYSFSAAEFIRSVDELGESDPLVVRINTNGGDPQSSFGMISKFQNHPGEKVVRVDGKAYSTGFFMCCFADNVVALDVSQFLIHRAAYPQWIESNAEYFTDEMKSNLKSINDSLLKALKAKIDVEAFENVTGTTLKEIFSMDSRKDVFIDAKQAKKIGLVSKIEPITPKMAASFESAYMESMAAIFKDDKTTDASSGPLVESQENQNFDNIMITKEEFKKQNPEAFNAMNAEAKQTGIENEKTRVAAWMEHFDVDPVAVKAGIESGKDITMDEIKAFYKKQAEAEAKAEAKGALENEGEAVEAIETNAPNENATEQTDVEAFEKRIRTKLGLEK